MLRSGLGQREPHRSRSAESRSRSRNSLRLLLAGRSIRVSVAYGLSRKGVSSRLSHRQRAQRTVTGLERKEEDARNLGMDSRRSDGHWGGFHW